MQNHKESQQLLATRLKASWASQSVDPVKLCKTLKLSNRQLSALVAGDDSAFHTRGLYLRAVEQAIQEAGLKDDPDVIENLSRLSEHYAQTPRGSQISLVQQTVNKRLAIAPRDPIERPPSRIGAFGAVILIISLVVIVMGVSMFAK